MAWSELRDVVSSLTFQSQRCDPFLSEHESLQMGLGFSVLRGYPVFSQHCLTEVIETGHISTGWKGTECNQLEFSLSVSEDSGNISFKERK